MSRKTISRQAEFPRREVGVRQEERCPGGSTAGTTAVPQACPTTPTVQAPGPPRSGAVRRSPRLDRHKGELALKSPLPLTLSSEWGR